MPRFAVQACLSLLMLATAGCASLVTAPDPWAPLQMAFTTPVEELERGARNGDRASQFALSFLAGHGLRGVPAERLRALELRVAAGRPRSTMITQYIAGVNGAPGRTIPMTINVPGLDPGQMRRMEACGLTLLANAPSLGRIVCTEPVWNRMTPLAADAGKAFRTGQARAASAASTPLP